MRIDSLADSLVTILVVRVLPPGVHDKKQIEVVMLDDKDVEETFRYNEPEDIYDVAKKFTEKYLGDYTVVHMSQIGTRHYIAVIR
jgi:hypothetical protein